MATVLLGSQTFGEPPFGYAVYGYYPGGPLSNGNQFVRCPSWAILGATPRRRLWLNNFQNASRVLRVPRVLILAVCGVRELKGMESGKSPRSVLPPQKHKDAQFAPR